MTAPSARQQHRIELFNIGWGTTDPKEVLAFAVQARLADSELARVAARDGIVTPAMREQLDQKTKHLSPDAARQLISRADAKP